MGGVGSLFVRVPHNTDMGNAIDSAFRVLQKYIPVLGIATGVLGIVDAATWANVAARMELYPRFWSGLFAFGVLAFSWTMIMERRDFQKEIEEAKNER